MTTSPLPIEIVIDRCLRAIREGNYSIEDCLAHYPEHKAVLEPLLITILRLQSARTLEVNQNYRDSAISRMKDLIQTNPRLSKRRARSRLIDLEKKSRISKSSSKKRFSFKTLMLVLLIGLVIIIISSVGIGFAASMAMPGSIFYPVKNIVEMARLEIFSDNYNDAILYLNFSQHRLEETQLLIKQQQLGEAKYALLDYQVEAHYTLEQLGDNSQLSDEQRLQLARRTIDYYSHNEAYLQVLINGAPDILRPSVETALELTRQILEQAKLLVN